MRAFLILLLAGLMTAGAAETGPVYVIPVRTAITKPQSLFFRRAVKEAERGHARAILLDMDTPGGEIYATTGEMEVLLKSTVPTYTYINSHAYSGGALLTLATQHIYMSLAGVIGAAAPVTGDGGNLETTMQDKVMSVISAAGRGAAVKCGHNPDLADCFIRKDATLVIEGVTLDGPATLLSLNATEATRQFSGRPVLAEGIAGSLEEVLRQAGLGTAVRQVQPTGFEQLAVGLTTLAPILLLIGLVGAGIELKTPGFGFPGIVAVIAFSLYFWSSYLAGLSGWEAVILFGVGVVLVLSELLLHPGTILPGLLGFVLIVGALLWAMVDHFPGDPLWKNGHAFARPMRDLGLAIAGAAIVLYFVSKYLPQSSLFRRIVLETTNPPGILAPVGAARVEAGADGIATTLLRPSGKAKFDGKIVDVITEGAYVAEGQAVRVLVVHGARVLVEPV